MTGARINRLWWIAVALAVVGSLLALFNAWTHYQRTGSLEWGRVALAVGVPVLMYAMARGAAARRP